MIRIAITEAAFDAIAETSRSARPCTTPSPQRRRGFHLAGASRRRSLHALRQRGEELPAGGQDESLSWRDPFVVLALALGGFSSCILRDL
jgi:hypothetical protein